MDEGHQLGVGRRVPAAVGCDALDPAVHPQHLGHCGLRLRRRAVGRGADELRGPAQAPERVVPVAGVVGHAGHGQRVQGLEQQGAHPADDHGGQVAVDLAGDAVGRHEGLVRIAETVPRRSPMPMARRTLRSMPPRAGAASSPTRRRGAAATLSPSAAARPSACSSATPRACHGGGRGRVHSMRFVVLGAGAIGGSAGPACSSGPDVTLVARGAHGRALDASGLHLEAPGETVTLPIPTVSEPALVSWTDDTVVLLGVKGQHTEHALTQLSVAPPSIAVVCLQNGVENERRVLRHFADTYGMCVMCPATQLRPGVIQVHSAPVSGMLDLGRFPSGLDDRGQAIADAIDATAFQSIARPDIMRWKCRKLLMNLANAAEALCGPGGRFSPLAKAAQREGVAALAAAGIDVASAEEDRERRGDLLQMAATLVGRVAGRVELAEPGPRGRFHRGRVPQRRDRPARPPPRRAHAGERPPANAWPSGPPPRGSRPVVDDRGVERGSRDRACRVSARRVWPTTSGRPTPTPSLSPGAAVRTSGPRPCRVRSGRSASSSTTSPKGTDRAPAGCGR